MPTATASKKLARAGAPSDEEIASAHYGIIPARIFKRDVAIPADLTRKILSERGEPLTPEQLFLFLGRPTNNLPDFYFTFQTMSSLRNYEQEAKDRSALMLVHDIYDLPIGKSYNAWIETDEVATPVERAAAIERRGGVRYALPLPTDDPLAWLFVEYYMVRGLNLGKKPNDEVVRGIMSGTLDQMSITFYAPMFRCTLCGLDIWDWDCPHIPGVEYDLGEGGEVLCLAAVEDGHMVETSLVYKAATPGAQVVETKARMLASTERLTSSEVRQLAGIEARLGHRFIDPAYYARALGSTTIMPALPAPKQVEPKEIGMTKRNTPSAPSIRTAPIPSLSPASATIRRRQPEDAPPAGDDDATNPDLEQVIADQATSDAAAIADQIEALNGQIAGLEEEIVGLEEQVAGAEAATDADGNPVDNAEFIAGLNTQIEATRTQIAELQAEVDALTAELEGVNETAEATGGTPTDPPAGSAGDGTTDTPAGAGTATASMQVVARARAAVGQMGAMFRSHLSAFGLRARSASAQSRKPVIEGASSLARDLNNLLVEAGEQPARGAGDQVIFGMLRRATGVRNPGVVQVRQLIQEAQAGRSYLEHLRGECERARVRSVGVERANLDQYRKMLRSLDVSGLEAELEVQRAVNPFTPGRRVMPVGGNGSVDVPDYPAPTSPTILGPGK